MTALVQEIMGRVQALPENKQEALLLILTNSESYDVPIIAEKDLTQEEQLWVEEGRQERKDDPGSFVSIEDYLAKTGRTVDSFSKRKIIYT